MTIDTITVEFSNWVIWNKHHDAKGTFKSIGPRTSLMKQKFYITEKIMMYRELNQTGMYYDASEE